MAAWTLLEHLGVQPRWLELKEKPLFHRLRLIQQNRDKLKL